MSTYFWKHFLLFRHMSIELKIIFLKLYILGNTTVLVNVQPALYQYNWCPYGYISTFCRCFTWSSFQIVFFFLYFQSVIEFIFVIIPFINIFTINCTFSKWSIKDKNSLLFVLMILEIARVLLWYLYYNIDHINHVLCCEQ